MGCQLFLSSLKRISRRLIPESSCSDCKILVKDKPHNINKLTTSRVDEFRSGRLDLAASIWTTILASIALISSGIVNADP